MSRLTRALPYPTRADLTPREIARLERGYTVLANGCWQWRGNPGRYAQFLCAGRRVQVHRLVYVLTYGDVPADHDIDHLCRNPRCVNPDHLEAVTHGENIRRGWAAIWNDRLEVTA